LQCCLPLFAVCFVVCACPLCLPGSSIPPRGWEGS
jgi:hypothetical protein